MKSAGPIEILLVDDREDGLLALEVVLGDGPYQLVKASSGREALAQLPLYNFAMILLDVQMPDLDGFETARLIRKTPGCELTPIIFVTAINKDEVYVSKGYDAGAVDYLFKPFEPHFLKSKVAVFAELHRKNMQIQEQLDLIANITERERVHERTRMELESLRRYQNLANAIPHLLWKTSPSGELIYCNEMWNSYTGYDVNTNAEFRWQNAFHPDDLQALLKLWLERMRFGLAFDMECRITRFDGAKRWHWLKTTPERNENGEVIAWIGTCTDINDRKILEDRALEALEMAESANKEKTYFLANMSHEIRTPLGAILGFSELLLDARRSQAEKVNFSNIIRNNGKQLLKIVDEVLDISRIEAGRLNLESVELNTIDFFKELFLSFNLKAVEKGLSLNFQPSTPLPRTIFTDAARYRQVLVNVISNAIKFTESGGVSVSIAWSSSDSGLPKLLVNVEDSGVGIKKDYVDKLFNPFVQGDSSTTRKFGGTGLGLALSRKIARALGGDVQLTSSEDSGSLFTIEILPERHSQDDWVSSIFEAQRVPQEDGDIADSALANISIMLAEDMLENQMLISQFLQMAGAKVSVVGNGQEAINLLEEQQFDVILMDLQMPVLDGYEATRRIRQNGYTKPIIAITAHALSEERAKCLQLGFDEHLTKPVDRNALIDRIGYFAGNAVEPHTLTTPLAMEM